MKMGDKSIKNYDAEYLQRFPREGKLPKGLDDLLERLMNGVAIIMDVNASSLILINKETENLYFIAATGEKKDQLKKFELKKREGIAGFVAEMGESLIVPDVSRDRRWYGKITDTLKFKVKSIAAVPLKIDGKTVGVLEIIDKINKEPFTNDDLSKLNKFAEIAAAAIGNAKKITRVKQENLKLKDALDLRYKIVGESRIIKKVVADALKVADSKVSTMILGESGTGKELLARLIHSSGPRRNKPLVILNCAALPETLLEDELFGHEKGAFTGAVSKKIGKFELADGGTIFLDEIGEMNLGMQVKLLRVLQEGTFCRVGGNKPVLVDVRVVAATNRDITRDVQEGKFREDLFYRLDVVQLRMPALRERREDIPILAKHFMENSGRETGNQNIAISDKALEKMMLYDWPGNVRELCNSIERAVVMGDGRKIIPDDLPMFSLREKYPGMMVGLTLEEAINKFKKEFIILNLEETGGIRGEAAKNMKIQRTYLSRLISKYNIRI